MVLATEKDFVLIDTNAETRTASVKCEVHDAYAHTTRGEVELEYIPDAEMGCCIANSLKGLHVVRAPNELKVEFTKVAFFPFMEEDHGFIISDHAWYMNAAGDTFRVSVSKRVHILIKHTLFHSLTLDSPDPFHYAEKTHR